MNPMEKALVSKKYLLEKYPGKGGWTYAAIPEIVKNKHAHFGWVSVHGRIDDYEINNYKLMPMGNGLLFLPVKAEIRKSIKKNEGDWVHIELFADSIPPNVQEEILICLKDEPLAYLNFKKLKTSQQQEYIDWVSAARNDDTKVERIALMLDRLLVNKKLKDS